MRNEVVVSRNFLLLIKSLLEIYRDNNYVNYGRHVPGPLHNAIGMIDEYLNKMEE